jgi:hypothetical protein
MVARNTLTRTIIILGLEFYLLIEIEIDLRPSDDLRS